MDHSDEEYYYDPEYEHEIRQLNMAHHRNSNGRYSRNDNRNNNNSDDQRKKHTGSKSGFDKNGNPYTTGWNYSRANGLVTFLATPYGKSKEVQSASGRSWLNVMVKVSRKMQKDFIVSGMMDLRSGMVTIEELGLVMNPKAKNGGYCGKYSK